jgi:hypothetical protein
MKINGHCNLLGLTNSHRNLGCPLLKKLHSAQLALRRNCGTQQPLKDRIMSLQQTDKKTIKNMGEITGIRQGGMGKSQNIALQTWGSYPQHVAATEQSTTALSPIAVASVHTRDGKHDRMAMLSGVNHSWSQASCSIMSRQRSTMHSPGATGQEGHDSQTF